MADVRLCLVGAGRWGKRYIDTIRTLDGATLGAVASRNSESPALVDCKVIADWRIAVAAPEIDAVIIATPPATHRDIALAAIDAGKPVLIEKPLTLSTAEATQIEQRAQDRSVMAMVSNIHLHNSAYQEMKRRLAGIGAIRHLRAIAGNWGPFRPETPPLWDWAPHDLSMCLDLMQGAPDDITATRLVEERIDNGYGGNYRIGLRFGSVIADIELGNMMPAKTRRLVVTGERGILVLDDVAATLTLTQAGTSTPVPIPPGRPLARQIEVFAEAVRAGKSHDSSLPLGRVIVELIDRCDSAPFINNPLV